MSKCGPKFVVGEEQTVISLDIFEMMEMGHALKYGHFLFSSGRHGDLYLEKFDLLRNPALTEQVCSGFADEFRGKNIDVVVGPTTGGILLAFETARQLRVMAAYAERATEGSAVRDIRRGTVFKPGTRVLVVDDLLTTGGSIRETLEALAPHPVEVVAIAVMIDRSGGRTKFGDIPLFALGTRNLVSWAPEECPLCAEGIPLLKPGTTAVANVASGR